MPVRLIIIIAMLAAALGLGFFLDWPKYQNFQRVLAEFEQKEAELNSKTAYYGKIKDIWGKLDDYEDALFRIDSAVPGGYSVPTLFNYLRNTAGQTGLVPKSIILSGVKEEQAKEISIDFKAGGSYASLKSFLSALENSARIFKIQKISFSPDEGGAFSFDLQIITYSY